MLSRQSCRRLRSASCQWRLQCGLARLVNPVAGQITDADEPVEERGQVDRLRRIDARRLGVEGGGSGIGAGQRFAGCDERAPGSHASADKHSQASERRHAGADIGRRSRRIVVGKRVTSRAEQYGCTGCRCGEGMGHAFGARRVGSREQKIAIGERFRQHRRGFPDAQHRRRHGFDQRIERGSGIDHGESFGRNRRNGRSAGAFLAQLGGRYVCSSWRSKAVQVVCYAKESTQDRCSSAAFSRAGTIELRTLSAT